MLLERKKKKKEKRKQTSNSSKSVLSKQQQKQTTANYTFLCVFFHLAVTGGCTSYSQSSETPDQAAQGSCCCSKQFESQTRKLSTAQLLSLTRGNSVSVQQPNAVCPCKNTRPHRARVRAPPLCSAISFFTPRRPLARSPATYPPCCPSSSTTPACSSVCPSAHARYSSYIIHTAQHTQHRQHRHTHTTRE